MSSATHPCDSVAKGGVKMRNGTRPGMPLFHLSSDDSVTKSRRLCDRKLEVVSLLLSSEQVVTVGPWCLCLF